MLISVLILLFSVFGSSSPQTQSYLEPFRCPIPLRAKSWPAEPSHSATTPGKTRSATLSPEDILADVFIKGYKIATSKGAVAVKPPKEFKNEFGTGSPKGRLTQRLECHLHTVEVTGSNPVSPIFQPLFFAVFRDFQGFFA